MGQLDPSPSLRSWGGAPPVLTRTCKKRCAAVPFETGIHFRRKTDFFPEEDTTKSYSRFEPEPTRLQN
ncbi:hypothetical protein TNCV_4993001 [Trichonephila clavipes]|nr:hypothetical protein TNCV_4993001 [Trichonephila clavipes]